MSFYLTDRNTGADLAQTFITAADAGIYLDGLGARGERYDITRRDDAPVYTDRRCIRCGDLGADPDLGNLCLECDYDTSGDYDAPTDHAGTVIAARARVELLDDHDKGTVTHTGNVTDDGTVTVMLDGARGTRGIAPHRLNVITPDAPHTGSRAVPAPGALAHTDAPSASVARRLQGTDIGRA